MNRSLWIMLALLIAPVPAAGQDGPSGVEPSEVSRDASPMDDPIAGMPTLRIEADRDEVECGAPFALTVTSTHDPAWTLDPLADRQLEPLTVRRESTERRVEDGRVLTVRRYRAQAFGLDEVTVPPLILHARPSAGGPERPAESAPLTIRVRTVLDAEAPGAAEWPGPPRDRPFPRLPWILSGATAILLAGAGAFALSRRAARRGLADDATSPSPIERALRRLEALRARHAEDPGEVEAFHEDAALLVREYLEGRFAIAAPRMTTEELSEATSLTMALAPPFRKAAKRLLIPCDRVKFNRNRPGPSDREDLLSAIEWFIETTDRYREPVAAEEPAPDAHEPAAHAGRRERSDAP